eukprot:superscaffoldBa00000750_g6991
MLATGLQVLSLHPGLPTTSLLPSQLGLDLQTCSLPVLSQLQPKTPTWAPAWLWEALGAPTRGPVVNADDNTVSWVTLAPGLSAPVPQSLCSPASQRPNLLSLLVCSNSPSLLGRSIIPSDIAS